MLLLIGWRGEIDDEGNQLKDEPQHVKQGQVTLSTLSTLGIPYDIIHEKSKDWKEKSIISLHWQKQKDDLLP